MISRQEIVSKLKIDNLPENKQDEIIERLENLIQRKVSLEIAGALSDGDVPEGKTESETMDILRDKIPNFDVLVKNVSIKTVNDFVEKVG